MLMRLMYRGPVPFLPLGLVLLFVSAPCLASHRHAPAGQPDLRSSAVFVLDESSSKVLLSRQAEVAAPIASITKLMTALVVPRPASRSMKCWRSPRPIASTAAAPFAPGIGTTLSRGDLLHLALMSSENRAAHALGRNYPGGLPAFVAAMNARARALGMTGAHFVDPTGLSSDNMASPEDLSKLVIAAAQSRRSSEYSTDEAHACGWAAASWSSTTPIRWYATRPGTSSCRRPATSPRPADAW